MIKGVTKSMIEINPKNSCFEKIIIILNESCEELDPDDILCEAKLLTRPVPHYLKEKLAKYRIKMFLCGASGAAFSAILFSIIYKFV